MKDLQIKVALKYGLLLGGTHILITTLYNLLTDPATIEQPELASIFITIVSGLATLLLIGLAHVEFNRKNNHELLFSQAISIGLIILALSLIVTSVLGYIQYAFFWKEQIAQQTANLDAMYGTNVGESFYSLKSVSLSYISAMLINTIFLFLLIMVEAQWKIYTKAGKEGWACLVPVYSVIVLLEITEKPTWWLLMFFIPIANLIFAIRLTNALGQKFGKDEGFTFGLIFLPFIFYPLLGLSREQYQGADELPVFGQ